MQRFIVGLILACALSTALSAQTQDAQDIRIFGYFQSEFYHVIPKDAPVNNSFALQQLNLFFTKDLGNRFTAFVNFEVTNSFSTERSWGNFTMEEAWVRWSPSAALNVQAGQLIPKFNALNEVKNKTPLLPYIFRPLVYEATISSLLDFEAYLPQRAFLQVYGSVSLSDIAVDYSMHLGNSEQRYIARSTTGIFIPGQDTTSLKSIGGRVGVRVSGIKLGVSGTYDRDKKTDMAMGNVPRVRFGADGSVSYGGVTLDGEYIAVNDKLTPANAATLTAISTMNPMVPNSLVKTFYYGNATVEVTDDLYTFVGYSYLSDKSDAILTDGLSSATLGAGYRPTESVVVKAQWAHFRLNHTTYFKLNQNSLYCAVSVLF